MSDAAIRAAIESRLNGMTPALATAWENVPFTPVDGTPYQRAYLMPAQPENPTIGALLQRLSGVYQINLFYPTGTGSSAAMTRALAIRARFPRGLTMTAGGVTVSVIETPEIGGGTVVGDRYLVPVRVRYRTSVFV